MFQQQGDCLRPYNIYIMLFLSLQPRCSLWMKPFGCYMKKNISGGARQAILRSLDSAVSSLLALISREYAQLVQRTTGLYTEGAPER